MNSFNGLKGVKRMAAQLSKASGVGISVSTVSCEKTVFTPGQFPIIRSAWERALLQLFAVYAPDRDNWWREYGVEFDNSTFRVIPFIWDGQCDCGFTEEAERWYADNQHGLECYQIRRDSMIEAWESEHGFDQAQGKKWNLLYDQRRAYEDLMSKPLCLEMQIPWNGGRGSACHCTCGKQELGKAWFKERDHKEPCPIWKMGLPNFLHKPSGYSVFWYKYPCRDGYGNQAMTARRFQKIIRECIGSLKGKAVCNGFYA